MDTFGKIVGAIASFALAQLILWTIAVSVMVLSWNYLLADFFSMEKITITVAIGILLVKNAIFATLNNEKA